MMSESLRVGFDVSDLSTGRADGTTRFTYELAKRLPQLKPETEWLYFSPDKIKDVFKFRNNNYQNIVSPWPKYWTQFRLPVDLYHFRPDVLLMPIQQLPYIRPGGMKTVTVVHDLAFHQFGEQFTRKDWLLLHVFTAQAVRQATKIIAVSHSTADDIARYYGREQNVFVVHHGVDREMFHPLNLAGKEAGWAAIKKKYSLIKRPYLLYVGQIQPRKNLVRLIEAFELLRDQGADLQLVLAGGHGWMQTPIFAKARQSKYHRDVVLTGRVDDELLPAFYANATAFVLPSIYEGFGMPILEAMACGCPTVTSNTSSMPEIAGGAAVLVDPDQTESIARGIEQAMQNSEELVKKGIAQAEKFSWEKCAADTARIILG